MLKSASELAALPPASDDIFYSNALERYAIRDEQNENVNLIDYMSERLTSRRTKVVLHHVYDKVTQLEDFCRVQLFLYIPWRDENKLKGEFETYAELGMLRRVKFVDEIS